MDDDPNKGRQLPYYLLLLLLLQLLLHRARIDSFFLYYEPMTSGDVSPTWIRGPRGTARATLSPDRRF